MVEMFIEIQKRAFAGVWRQLLPADDQVRPLQGDPGPVSGEGGDLHAGQVRGHLRQVLQHVSPWIRVNDMINVSGVPQLTCVI